MQAGLRTIIVAAILAGLVIFTPLQATHAAPPDICPSGCTYSTIGAAVSAISVPGVTLTIGAGTYHEHDITVNQNVTLKGAGSGLVTVDAQSNGRIFYVSSGTVVSILGMTLKNGNITTTDYDGGAIFSQADSLTVNDVKFLNNYADDMGGAVFSEGNLTISNSTFDGNHNNTARATGASGGAIAMASLASLSLDTVTLTNNTARDGGAIAILAYGHTAGQTFTMTNSTVANNIAIEQGGGIFDDQIDTTITNSTINDNNATGSPNSFGGGLYYNDASGTISLQNVTISHNQSLNGGGILIGPVMAATLNAVTITLNGSTDAVNNGGGGIYLYAAMPLDIQNSIVAGNTDAPGGTDHPDCYAAATSITYSLIGDVTGCGATTFTNDLTGVSPQLDALANYGGPTFTHRPQSGSPAIDAADNATCPSTDQRGIARPLDGNVDSTATCDMGAFEVRPPTTVSFKSTGTQDGSLLESSEMSGVAGAMNSTATTFQLGDDAGNRQYRAILSFNTAALPDLASIQSAVLQIKKSGATVGANPFNVLGTLWVDIRKGPFGTAALQLSDFNSPASAAKVGGFNKVPVSGWYSDTLKSNALLKIDVTGLTQLRLYFGKDDNNNHVANYMRFFSGNSTPANRPVLTIIYNLP